MTYGLYACGIFILNDGVAKKWRAWRMYQRNQQQSKHDRRSKSVKAK